MRLRSFAVLLFVAACGAQRDPSFQEIVMFSAVTKLQVSASFVYFYEASGFERVSTAGGTIETLLGDATVHDFAVVPGFAFVATDHGLVRIDTGTGADPLSFTSEKVTAVAADPFGVAWLSCSGLTQASLQGSARTVTPIDGSCDGALLALDTSTAYVTTSGTTQLEGGTWFVSRSGALMRQFASGPLGARMAAGGGWLYASDETGVRRTDPLTLESDLLMAGDVRDFAVGAQNLYLSVDADLVSLPRNGGGQTVLGTYASITAVAVDDQNVYFVNTDAAGLLGLLVSTAL